MTRHERDDRGVVTAFVAIVATGLLAAAGLVHDGGQLLGRYREAGDLAAEASRAAAQGVDTPSLRAGTPLVDARDARARADAFLAATGHAGAGVVSVDGAEVTVRVTLPVEGLILPLASRDVTASASASLAIGVEGTREAGR